MPAVARASDDDEYEMARGMVDAAQYPEAAARFARMLDPAASPCAKTAGPSAEGCRLTDAAVIQRARGLFAVALHAVNKPNESKDQFKQLLRENPTFSPSPALYPPKVIVLFTEAKKEIEVELTAATILLQKKKAADDEARKKYEAWQEDMERLAASETVITSRSRWVAAIPFGVGQFQNDDIGLGVLFMSIQGLAATGGIVTAAIHASDTACATTPEKVECGELQPTEYEFRTNDKLMTLKIVNIVSFSVLCAAAIVGIIEAETSFDAEVKTVRKRKLPPRPPKPAPPTIGLSGVPDAPDAMGLGLTLSF